MFDWVKEGNVAVLQRLLRKDPSSVLSERDDDVRFLLFGLSHDRYVLCVG